MRYALSVALLVLAYAAFAQNVKQSVSHSHDLVWEPPEWNYPQELKASVPKEMFSTFGLSGYNIVFEETSIESVQKHVGGKAGKKGDAGDALEWLCFHGADTAGRWVIWLESGEINGGSVGSFQWQRLSNGEVLDARCHALAGNGVSLPLSLRLGAQKAEVLTNLGAPTSSEPERLIYLHEHKSTIRGEPFTISTIVVIDIRNEVVWAIRASKTSSS
jgi:hypothetical protein